MGVLVATETYYIGESLGEYAVFTVEDRQVTRWTTYEKTVRSLQKIVLEEDAL